ncbi:uncharacterized protein B0T15DRAFT_505249 [Chaetomium strumarium]|uniref:Uncharacterized protein n=1 Tax=Chaetomium strumarium TaxID=1170767 RepID=A0AAJ0LYC6_9PEZI|nr:hypothetical protein B0T15DRAFT_505249 [Chaetomium strumarium]
MASASRLDEDTAQAALARQMIEEFISLRIAHWKTKQRRITDREVAAQIAALCWDYDSLPDQGPGCLLPDRQGGYVYVPYDGRREGLPPDILRRALSLDHWEKNPANCPVILQMDKLLEKEVDEKCFWEFLDGGNASGVDFHGKIKILAKYRLMKGGVDGVDVSPSHPRIPQFKFAVTHVTEFGRVKMQWCRLNWGCSEKEIQRCLDAAPKPQYRLDTIRDRLLRELGRIQQPEDAVREAKDLVEELKSDNVVVEYEAEWSYFLTGNLDEATARLEKKREWKALKTPDDVKLMKCSSNEQGRWPIMARPWEMRNHDICFAIFKLQQRQLLHAQQVEKAALNVKDKNGQPYFTGG